MKKIFNVATYQRDESLFRMMDSIYNQADEINIALNLHDKIPNKFLNDPKINCFLTDNLIGDGYKYYKLNESDGYFFTVDDDLIYPSDYAQYMIEKFEQYSGMYIVTLHGRVFYNYPIGSYYRSPHHNFTYFGDMNEDVFVHFGGSGVMMFHTNLLKFPYTDIKSANMGDIWLAKFANEKGIRIICIKHKMGYILNVPGVRTTIFDTYKFNDKAQTDLANTIKFS
jgi:hypothetical protein